MSGASQVMLSVSENQGHWSVSITGDTNPNVHMTCRKMQVSVHQCKANRGSGQWHSRAIAEGQWHLIRGRIVQLDRRDDERAGLSGDIRICRQLGIIAISNWSRGSWWQVIPNPFEDLLFVCMSTKICLYLDICNTTHAKV